MEFRTEQEILNDLLDYAVNINLLNIDTDLLEQIKEGTITENQYILDLSVHAHILEDLENLAREIYEGLNINTATGEYLDMLGALVNVERRPATPAILEITASLSSNSQNISIPAGTEVLLEPLWQRPEFSFITSEDVNISAGVTSINIRCESSDYGLKEVIPEGAAIGLNGFPQLTVTNNNSSTRGQNIEEDTEYKQRIVFWSASNTKGTKAAVENYLENYTGLDHYKLIPRFDGVGTLKIVCDTLPSELDRIAAGVTENVMLITDEPVTCVLVENYSLASINYNVIFNSTINRTVDEIKQDIINQTRSFIEGGLDSAGRLVKGLNIGEDLNPSQLLKYLQEQISEISNIRTNMVSPVSVPDTHILKVDSVSVEVEQC